MRLLLIAVVLAQPALNPKLARATALVPTLKGAGMSTFLGLLDIVTLEDLGLTPESPYHTFFVPTNAAFGRLPAGALDALKRDPERLRRFLLDHLVQGNITVEELPAEIADGTSRTKTQLETRRGSTLKFSASVKPGTHFPRINDKARIGRFQDVHVSDYRLVIHEIDAVLGET